MRKLKSSKKGFTLIELIVVVTVIAILAAIAIPVINNFSQTAKASADASDVALYQAAIERFVASGNAYPGNAADAQAAIRDNTNVSDIPAPRTGGHYYYVSTVGSSETTYRLGQVLKAESEPTGASGTTIVQLD